GPTASAGCVKVTQVKDSHPTLELQSGLRLYAASRRVKFGGRAAHTAALIPAYPSGRKGLPNRAHHFFAIPVTLGVLARNREWIDRARWDERPALERLQRSARVLPLLS